MRLPVPDSEREPLARFVLVFGGLVVAWACLHDLYLIRVEPRHFTDYHRPLLPITNHALLAVQYATVATLGPGLVFGFLAWLSCRAGARAKVSLGNAAGGFALVMLAVEGVLLLLGARARARIESGSPPLYPLWAYPDETAGILVSQTVNISAYLIAPAAGALYLLARFLGRRRSAG
jgi:hypothetical protein